MRKSHLISLYLLLGLLFSLGVAHAEGLSFATVPDILRPGKYYDIVVNAPSAGQASLSLLDAAGNSVYDIFVGYPMSQGRNVFQWEGMRLDQTIVAQGEYTLLLQMEGSEPAEKLLRVGSPYPMLTSVSQSDSILEDDPITVTFLASEGGFLRVRLMRYADGVTEDLDSVSVTAGLNTYAWHGDLNGEKAAPGDYALLLTLRTANGAESLSQSVFLQIGAGEAEDSTSVVVVDLTPAPTSEPTPAPTPEPALVSPPYSTIDDGTFWSMTPGELDDAVIWDILMQPIVVYDGGLDAKPKVHTWMMQNPDGTGEKIAQLHAQSQGLHVIGEPNEHGYVLVEAFSNYDENYNPKTEEEIAHAYDVKQGYVLAKNLKTVEVMTDMALLIDKKTQRMYLYKDGVRVTEFLIATGLISDKKYYNETIAGEYITISHTGAFTSGNMICDLAIRINGGILIHEVPHKERADGSRDYSSFEGYLGTKQSHGCIRVQRLKNDDGYNMRWIWDNFKRGKPYKVIIWDDLNRVDSPSTLYPNPKN